MKQLKIIIIILLIILTITSLLLYMSFKTKETETITQTPTTETENKTITLLDNRNMFFTVSTCVNRYIDYIVKKNNNSLYLILDAKYIAKNNITEQNILNSVDKITNKQVFIARKIYEMAEDNYNSTFYVYGTIRDDKDEEKTQEKDFYITVKLNYENNTFSIIPFEYIPKNAIIK